MRKIPAVLFLCITVFSSCKKIPLLTEQEAIDVINRFDEGWKNKNLQAVDSALCPAYIYFTQSGGTFSRKGVVETAGSADYKLEHVWRHAVEVTLYENTAVVSTRWEGKGVYRGVPFDEDQRCSIIVIKTNNKVEILSEHCTPVKSDHKFH